MTTTHFLRRLAELTVDASTDELRIIVAIAERLNLGRERYGALCIANDERDWQVEAREEGIDMAIYRAIASLKERDERVTLPPPPVDDRAVPIAEAKRMIARGELPAVVTFEGLPDSQTRALLPTIPGEE